MNQQAAVRRKLSSVASPALAFGTARYLAFPPLSATIDRMMVLPRFSLRWIFLATTVFAGVSLILAQAVRGQHWALALSFAMFAAVVLMLMQAFIFGVASVIRMLTARRDLPLAGESPFAASPFAETTPVKQVVEPPADPDL